MLLSFIIIILVIQKIDSMASVTICLMFIVRRWVNQYYVEKGQ